MSGQSSPSTASSASMGSGHGAQGLLVASAWRPALGPWNKFGCAQPCLRAASPAGSGAAPRFPAWEPPQPTPRPLGTPTSGPAPGVSRPSQGWHHRPPGCQGPLPTRAQPWASFLQPQTPHPPLYPLPSSTLAGQLVEGWVLAPLRKRPEPDVFPRPERCPPPPPSSQGEQVFPHPQGTLEPRSGNRRPPEAPQRGHSFCLSTLREVPTHLGRSWALA
ncbi:basic proline-rich protein-like [Hippopotamus amphibius kiboko]|uniref:basic proline-rich protein-like n=1 Tax=Hippopotamus amphibius kiboko TaxID=575201 RepID=UPI0025987A34|nr:basic proline-rich protein-like [Hippopotamus amphibius kiboko]